jgi:hypothetical protein
MDARVYRVKCRNPDCSNPAPDRVFEFPVEDDLVFRGPLGNTREYEREILIVTCPHCGWKKRIYVSKGDPNDKDF